MISVPRLFEKRRFPLVFAHRGAHAVAPENSLQSFEEAIQMGCDGIELDIRFTATRDIVVFHDRRLLRMTGRLGKVHKMPIEKLRRIYLRGDPNHRIPTLEDVLDLLRDRVLINLDIKPHPFYMDGLEAQLIKMLRDFKLRENIIISSFNFKILKRIAALAPEYHLGYIFRHKIYTLFIEREILHSMHPNYRLVNRLYVDHLHERGFSIHVWTVDRAKAMEKMIRLGVDAIITNKPEVYFQVVKKIQEESPLVTQG